LRGFFICFTIKLQNQILKFATSLKTKLAIMFNTLSDKLDKAFHILKGHGKITEV